MVERRERVMGMPVRMLVRDTVAPGALDDAFAWLRWVDATFSTYDARSEICRIQRGALSPAAAHPLVREVLDRCAALREETGRRVRRDGAARRPPGPDGAREGLGGRPRGRASSPARARATSASTPRATCSSAAARGASGSGTRVAATGSPRR